MFFSIDGPQIKLTTESLQARKQNAMRPGDKVLLAILGPPQIAVWNAPAAVVAPLELAADLHDHLHPSTPCPAKTHQMKWKTKEARVETLLPCS